jgi:Tol biopolymer transport system component
MSAARRLGAALALAIGLMAPAGAQSPAPMRNGELPAISPDGAQIAFESDRSGATGLYLVGVDGAGTRNLVPDVGESSGPPVWSADGRHLRYATAAGGVGQLYEVDVRSGSRRLVATVPGRGPTLSPDRRHILFMAGPYTSTTLMVADLNGAHAHPVSVGAATAWMPQWSPDGRRIAFTGRSGATDELKIFLVNADGSGLRQVTYLPPEAGNAQWSVWSPDGNRLAIQVDRAREGDARIWLVELATGEAHPIGRHDHAWLDETPSWFPDGGRLAIQSNRTGRMEVWVMNADGSGERQVTR